MGLDKSKLRLLKEVKMPKSQRRFLSRCGVRRAYWDKEENCWYAEKRRCGAAVYFRGRGSKTNGWERVW